MNEFQKKLNVELHKYKAQTGEKLYNIADNAGIHRKRMYNFTSGERGLNDKDVASLMEYMNITVKLEEVSQ